MTDDRSHLSSSQSLYASTSSLPNSKLCSQTYKSASQLFLTRRLQESLATLTPILTTSANPDDVPVTNGNDDSRASPNAPIAFASSNVRIKVWNLYITLLSNVVDLGPEEGRKEFGQKEWKTLVAKVRDGIIWEEIVQAGYQGLEGSVDADVVYNLGTLLLTHSASQTLNQQRLETYLSAYGQPNLDVAAHLENSPSDPRRLSRNGGTDTPKDLTARVKIIELFVLHVLPRNEEWDYATVFVQLSEVLDEERKESFLQTLNELKEEKERGVQRAAELQREKEAEMQRQIQEEEKRKTEAAAAAERLKKTNIDHKRASSEVDYGIEKTHPNGTTKSRSSKADKPGSEGKSSSASGRTAFSPPASSSKNTKKAEKATTPVSRQMLGIYNLLRNILKGIKTSVAGNPMALLRTMLFTLGILMALSRQDVRERIRRLTNSSWQKVRGTVGMVGIVLVFLFWNKQSSHVPIDAVNENVENNNVTEKSEDGKKRTILKKVVLFILSQWLLIGMGIACLLAYFFPNVAKHGGVIKSEYSILYGAVAFIFFVSGLSIPHRKLYTHMFNWRLHVLVQVTSFLFVPAVVVALVHLIVATDPASHIDRAVLAGYILTACIPTTIASNVVMTQAAGGDDAAALVEVLIANFLGPFLTAGWTVALIPKTAEFQPWRDGGGDMSSMYKDVFKQLGLSALLPLIIGQLIRWTWEKQVTKMLQKLYVGKLSTACMLLLIWTTFSSAFATGALETLSTQSIIFTVLFNVAFYLFLTIVCFYISRPPAFLRKTFWGKRIFMQVPAEETIAICFCGPAKTTALGIPLLYAMYTNMDLFTKAKTSIPVLLYTTEQICVAHFMVYVFRRWKRRLENKTDVQDEENTTGVTE
ncbi:SBF-like CPA transporter family-domain-containing protein [Talaromyces proteolyticus]|uniref:SBF-like CPA transporter family-domain-containing protein n=1 Tax=Talaromyces proteolyticus TaxID=1131652 RepID=A0AAD4L632_9EURO|nr:SBF-like CPA transporter family-domain-containing protein [Talaromyces proteolyticus]KAH8705275.1 SBF-like CPA transporter family-domain-containing protein [Talaromyces proteolyticus]